MFILDLNLRNKSFEEKLKKSDDPENIQKIFFPYFHLFFNIATQILCWY